MSFLAPFASTWLALGLILSTPAALAQNKPPAGTDVASVAQASSAEPSSSARALFSRSKDGIVQVRLLLTSAGEQSSLGSGFLVRDDGAKGAWVVTNYHVVSALAIDPQKYRIELRGSNQRVARARLVALDVVHDLAVLRTEPDAGAHDTGAAWHVLKLRDAPLVQGSKVYSLGNPLELGFLISEGIYNGSVESRIYEQMLFSGALNSGMSGGPAIDDNGEVVGVNVATRRDGEQLSFLVPKRYALDLLQTAWRNDSGARLEWRTEIARQLLTHQHFVASKLLTPPASASGTVPGGPARAGFSSQVLSGRAVPTLDGNLTKCWANGMDGERLRYQRDQLNCNLQSTLFVRGNLYTGNLSISHTLLRNDRLATPQFLALDAEGHHGWRGSGERTRAECQDDYVQTASHVYRVAICARAYRKFEGVYDYSVQATQVDDARERLSSRIDLRGFSFDNARSLGRMFLERLQ